MVVTGFLCCVWYCACALFKYDNFQILEIKYSPCCLCLLVNIITPTQLTKKECICVNVHNSRLVKHILFQSYIRIKNVYCGLLVHYLAVNMEPCFMLPFL